MPQLNEIKLQTKKLYLPSYKDLAIDDQGWVMIDLGPLNGDDLVELDSPDKPVAVQFDIIANRIRDWNFTEPDGSLAPINQSTVRRLNFKDITFLIGEVNEEGVGETVIPKETTSD